MSSPYNSDAPDGQAGRTRQARAWTGGGEGLPQRHRHATPPLPIAKFHTEGYTNSPCPFSNTSPLFQGVPGPQPPLPPLPFNLSARQRCWML